MGHPYRAGVRGVALATAAYTLAVRPWQLRWGATVEEATAPVAGDDLIAEPDITATRAITIRTTAENVWPWIAQLGQGRGGFYSYDMLENLVGCDIRSADHIMPEWQDIAVGDQVRLHPEVGLAVVAVERGRSFVLRGGVPMRDTPPPYDFTWAFDLRERDEVTRLLVRERYAYSTWWAALLVEPVEAVSFVMSKKMLRGIKGRAEADGVASAHSKGGTT
jgi:hypothetical protein